MIKKPVLIKVGFFTA